MGAGLRPPEAVAHSSCLSHLPQVKVGNHDGFFVMPRRRQFLPAWADNAAATYECQVLARADKVGQHEEGAVLECPRDHEAILGSTPRFHVGCGNDENLRAPKCQGPGSFGEADVTPLVLGDDLEGEARGLGGLRAALAVECALGGEHTVAALREALVWDASRLDPPSVSPPRPLVLLSGGETTVSVRGGGRGGRNSEYALGLALGLDGHPGAWALAADTDDTDGSADNAGVYVAPDSVARACAIGLDPAAALAANDAYGLLAALGDLLVTGPTRTNVNDFRAVLVRD